MAIELGQGVEAESAWKVWMGFDLLLGEPQDPGDVHLSMIGKADYWLQKALARRDAGDYDAAVHNYNEAIKIDPRCWIVRAVAATATTTTTTTGFAVPSLVSASRV